eukprot:269674-Chlamydomonas_euryale.AAC.1
MHAKPFPDPSWSKDITFPPPLRPLSATTMHTVSLSILLPPSSAQCHSQFSSPPPPHSVTLNSAPPLLPVPSLLPPPSPNRFTGHVWISWRHTCQCGHGCISSRAISHTCTAAHTCPHLPTLAHSHTLAHTRAHSRARACARTHARTHARAHAHTHTHTLAEALSPLRRHAPPFWAFTPAGKQMWTRPPPAAQSAGVRSRRRPGWQGRRRRAHGQVWPVCAQRSTKKKLVGQLRDII